MVCLTILITFLFFDVARVRFILLDYIIPYEIVYIILCSADIRSLFLLHKRIKSSSLSFTQTEGLSSLLSPLFSPLCSLLSSMLSPLSSPLCSMLSPLFSPLCSLLSSLIHTTNYINSDHEQRNGRIDQRRTGGGGEEM
jgi:hypothetical protein